MALKTEKEFVNADASQLADQYQLLFDFINLYGEVSNTADNHILLANIFKDLMECAVEIFCTVEKVMDADPNTGDGLQLGRQQRIISLGYKLLRGIQAEKSEAILASTFFLKQLQKHFSHSYCD